MKQREITVNLYVTNTLLVKTRRYVNYSDERNFRWKQCFFLIIAPYKNFNQREWSHQFGTAISVSCSKKQTSQ